MILTFVAKKNIMTNECLSEENICVKRNRTGLPASMWDFVIGKPAMKNYESDEAISL